MALFVGYSSYNSSPNHSEHCVGGWCGASVRCRCDSAAVVAIIRCKDELAMHLLRCLFFFVAAFDIKLWSVHVPGVCNGAADALSRDNHTSFLAQARRQADVIPPEMLEVLVAPTGRR